MRVREDDFYTMGNIDTIDTVPSIRTWRWRGGERRKVRVEGGGGRGGTREKLWREPIKLLSIH